MTETGWTIAFRPYALLWLLLVLGVGVVSWRSYRQTIPPISDRRRRILLALRIAALSLLAVVALAPKFEWRGFAERRPRVTVLVDRSESMGFADSYGMRSEEVRAALAGSGFERLDGSAEIKLVGFAGDVAPVKPDDIEFDGNATAIGEAIIEQRRHLPAPDYVVMLSDGVNTAGADPVRAATEASLPIYTLGVGDPMPQADLRIVGVSAPEIALSGRQMKVTATLENIGLPQGTVPIRIVSRGRTVVSERIRLPAPGSRADVELSMTAGGEGLLKASVEVDSIPGELLSQNNSWPFTTTVLKAKRRVLVVAGAPSADIAFWIRHFSNRDDIEARLWLTTRPGRRGPSPIQADSLTGTDILIWYDVPPSALTQAQLAAIEQAVASGAGLLVFPGRRALPGALSDMLPTSSVRSTYVQQEVRTEIPPNAARFPLYAKDSEFPRWSARWNVLPPLQARTIGAIPKPYATILLTGNGNPLAVAGRYRAGRVITFLGTTYWRWDTVPVGLGEDGSPATGFWDAVVRWLGTRQSLSRVRLQADSPLYRHGEPIRLVAQVYDEAYQPLDGADVRVVVDDGAVAAAASASGDGTYTATVTGLSAGEHRAVADAVRDGATLGTGSAEFTISVVGVEHEETRQDRAALEQIAKVSSGAYAPIAKADSLLEHIDLPTISEPRERTIAFATSPWMLLAIVALLSAEWIARRLRGLL